MATEFEKKVAPSAKRHARETLAKIAKEAGFWSPTTYRRIKFVSEYGTGDIKEALENGQVTTWFAYNYVKRQQLAKLRDLLKTRRALSVKPEA